MAKEIERKFLVTSDEWRRQARGSARYRQGYLSSDPGCSIRVRIADGRAWLNLKSATLGVSRTEFDYPIPVVDAEEILERLCSGPVIDKTRWFVDHAGHTWEVDEFHGDNEGLVVAEIELPSEDAPFERPAWVGEEVSHDPRYYNVCLATHPYKDWPEAQPR